MARSTQSQTNHNWMVQQMADAYTRLGHQLVKADHIAHNNGAPSQLGNHIPDVTAVDAATNKLIICEVETTDSIGDQHTHSQLLTFRQAANQLGGFLHVGLPFKSDLAAAQAVVAGWGIGVDQWWYGDSR